MASNIYHKTRVNRQLFEALIPVFTDRQYKTIPVLSNVMVSDFSWSYIEKYLKNECVLF